MNKTVKKVLIVLFILLIVTSIIVIYLIRSAGPIRYEIDQVIRYSPRHRIYVVTTCIDKYIDHNSGSSLISSKYIKHANALNILEAEELRIQQYEMAVSYLNKIVM